MHHMISTHKWVIVIIGTIIVAAIRVISPRISVPKVSTSLLADQSLSYGIFVSNHSALHDFYTSFLCFTYRTVLPISENRHLHFYTAGMNTLKLISTTPSVQPENYPPLLPRPDRSWGTVQGYGYVTYMVGDLKEIMATCRRRRDCKLLYDPPVLKYSFLFTMVADPEGNIVELVQDLKD